MFTLALQAYGRLLWHDIFLSRHDFAELHARVHLLPVAPRSLECLSIEMICNAVAYACIWYPKTVLCLQRSIVVVALLRNSGVRAELVIGAQRLPLKSHAWVEIDGRVVNDKPEVQTEYLVIERC